MKKIKQYQVRSTEGIALEMVRYEHNKIVSKEHAMCDSKWKTEHLIQAYTTYLYTIEGIPCGRWKSFGISNIQVL